MSDKKEAQRAESEAGQFGLAAWFRALPEEPFRIFFPIGLLVSDGDSCDGRVHSCNSSVSSELRRLMLGDCHSDMAGLVGQKVFPYGRLSGVFSTSCQFESDAGGQGGGEVN